MKRVGWRVTGGVDPFLDVFLVVVWATIIIGAVVVLWG